MGAMTTAPTIPVWFRETDDRGRVSLANASTQRYLADEGIQLIEGAPVRLCEPISRSNHRLDWRVAEGRAVFLPEFGRWMAELETPILVASEAPREHWGRRIDPGFLGPLAD